MLAGATYTFTARFISADAIPVAVNTPVITVSYYDSTGTRQVLLNAVPMTAESSVVGLYKRVFQVPVLDLATNLLVYMTGTDALTDDPYVLEDVVTIVAPAPVGGMIVRFIG